MVKESDIAKKVLVTLRKIIRAIDIHSKKLVQKYGITSPQLIILQEINRGVEVSVGQLARNVILSDATVTVIIDRLEKQGLVVRTRSLSDKRKVLINLTEKGEEILKKAPPLLQERFTEELNNLETWEQTLILSSLQRIASMMEAEELSAKPHLFSESDSAIDPNTVKKIINLDGKIDKK